MYKLTIEWNANELPTWFNNLGNDNRCISMQYQKGVSKEEFERMIDKTADGKFIDRKLARAFVSVDYYIEG